MQVLTLANRRTRTCRTGYAHPRTWNLAGRLVGAAKTLTYADGFFAAVQLLQLGILNVKTRQIHLKSNQRCSRGRSQHGSRFQPSARQQEKNSLCPRLHKQI